LPLKAYLRGAEWNVGEKKLGHDITKCLDEAVVKGLENHVGITKEIYEMIDMVNPIYKDKNLEYIATGFYSFPEFETLISFSGGLLSIAEEVLDSNAK